MRAKILILLALVTITLLITPTVLASINTTTPIMGSFISFPWSRHANNSLEDWKKEFDDMQRIGIHTLIIAGVLTKGYGTPDIVIHYNSLETILNLADERGLTVYVSPVDRANYWSSPENMTDLISTSKTTATEIYQKYNSHPSFTGWYVQPEILLNADNPDYSPSQQLTSHYKSLSPTKKVLSAPYFIPPCSPDRLRCENQWWPNRTPQEIANQAKLFLQNTGIDILAIQDGAGASGVTIEELARYLPAIDQAVKSIGKEFWVDLEIFRYNDTKTDFIPATISQINGQIQQEKNYPLVIWIFEQFMGPNVNSETLKLYNDYLATYTTSLPGDLNNNGTSIFLTTTSSSPLLAISTPFLITTN